VVLHVGRRHVGRIACTEGMILEFWDRIQISDVLSGQLHRKTGESGVFGPTNKPAEISLIAKNIGGCFTLGVAGDKIVPGQIGKGVIQVCSDGDLGVMPL